MEADVNAYQEGRVVKYDGLLSASGANLDTLEDIGRAGPFGIGNPGPRFVVPNAKILHVAVMKDKHLQAWLLATNRAPHAPGCGGIQRGRHACWVSGCRRRKNPAYSRGT